MKTGHWCGWTGVMLLAGAGVLRAESEWGEANAAGLRTRLVPVNAAHAVGQPVLFRLEVQNTGREEVLADVQSLAHPDRLLTCTDAAGRPVSAISPALAGCQTIEHMMALPPGKVTILAGGIDAAQDFEISKAGAYQFRHPGLAWEFPEDKAGAVFANIPPSPVVTIELAEGELPVDLELIVRLRPILPEGWFLCRRGLGDGVQFGTHLRDGGVRIDVVAAAAEVPVEDGYRLLGASPLGEIRIAVEMDGGNGRPEAPPKPALGDLWPGVLGAICKALEVVPADV